MISVENSLGHGSLIFTRNPYLLPLFGDRKPIPYLPRSQFTKVRAQLSPDGRWMAYTSDESGRNEVYAQTFPNPSGRWQISATGGASPRWRRDAKELFYIASDGKLMAVPVRGTGTAIEISEPTPLYEILTRAGVTGVGNVRYDVAGDGERFLVVSVEDRDTTPLSVVLNWTNGLKK